MNKHDLSLNSVCYKDNLADTNISFELSWKSWNGIPCGQINNTPVGTKPSLDPVITYLQLSHQEHNMYESFIGIQMFYLNKFKNDVGQMSTILFKPRCDKWPLLYRSDGINSESEWPLKW